MTSYTPETWRSVADLGMGQKRDRILDLIFPFGIYSSQYRLRRLSRRGALAALLIAGLILFVAFCVRHRTMTSVRAINYAASISVTSGDSSAGKYSQPWTSPADRSDDKQADNAVDLARREEDVR